MPEIINYYANGAIFIDSCGNKYCDLNRYQDAIICIIYDASNVICNDVQFFSNSKNPDVLPSNNGIFIPVKGEAGKWVWKDITHELYMLKLNRFIDIAKLGAK